MNPILHCPDCEAQLSEYRDGTLAPDVAAAVRRHLDTCAACRELHESVALAIDHVHALPEVDPPARLLAKIHALTLPPSHHRAAISANTGNVIGRLWASISSPRFALGLAMSIFVASILLSTAQVNLRQVSLSSLTPGGLAGAVERQVGRTWARGVSYYNDLRVVYQIEAAIHQMRQPPPAPNSHDHSQSAPHNPALDLAFLISE
ncbi:MAG TPA: anti-sigma factor [Terriglobales bacterium]|nr:anti-sigma factor [Terriglobales bacterium]